MKFPFPNSPQLVLGRCLPALSILILFTGCLKTAAPLSVNPYQDVNWGTVHRHNGNFHTHTTESDGHQPPADVIDAYHQLGHEVLALTDHNKYTWPWTAFGRDADELGMVAVPGNELSRVQHTLSLFSELVTDTQDHEEALKEVEAAGGISVLAHPGRYWELEGGKVPDQVRDRYVRLFKEYPTLIGFEVVNQADRYPRDRALWDALLTELMPDRPVWGMANDDSHVQKHIGLNVTVLLLAKPDRESVREALETGHYYFKTVATHPDEERSIAETPEIRNLTYNSSGRVLTLNAVSGGRPVPEENITWISAGGTVVHRGPVIDLDEVEGLRGYVRAEILGKGGTTFTQPFGLPRDK